MNNLYDGHWMQNEKRRGKPRRKKTGGTYDKAFRLRKPALEKSLDAAFKHKAPIFPPLVKVLL